MNNGSPHTWKVSLYWNRSLTLQTSNTGALDNQDNCVTQYIDWWPNLHPSNISAKF